MKRSVATLLFSVVLLQSGALLAQETGPSEFIEKILRAMEKKGGAAVPPIVISKNARNFKDVEKEQRAWWERVLVQPAMTRMETRGDIAWKKDAAKFLMDAPPIVFSSRIVATPYPLAELGHQLVAGGCDDPAVLLLAGLVDRMCRVDWRFAEICALKAAQALDADPASKAVLAYHVDNLLAWAYFHGGHPPKRKLALEKSIAAAVRMAEDGSFLPEETEIYLRQLYLVAATEELAAKMIDLAPKLPLPLWARQLIVGKSEISLAWKDRGSGWANTVNEAGWKGFAEHLTRARTALVEAWKANPKVPFAAEQMITVVIAGHGENDDTLQLWFNRAIAAQCDYYPAYNSILWAYRPRWCGGHELMLAFGKACAATKRYDLDIPLMFDQACDDIVSEIGDWREFYRRPDIAKTLMELSEGYVREPSRKDELKMRQSYYAVNAWLVGDTKRAATTLVELGGPLHPDTQLKLASHRVSEADMRKEIAIANSPSGPDFNKALALYKAGKLEDAESSFRHIEPTALGLVKDSVHENLSLIEIEKKLASGDWVTLPVDPDLHGWLQRGGNWSGTAEGVLVNTGNDSYGAVVHRARVGPDFEMKVEYSVDAKLKCCRRCDILFGWHNGFQEPYNIAAFGQSGTSPSIAWISNRTQRISEVPNVKIPYQEKNLMLLHSENKKLTFMVNGKAAFTDFTPKDVDFPEDGRVGINSFRWCSMNVTKISKIEVRRLGGKAL